MMQSDAYYLHRLLEQVQGLQQRLSQALGEDAALTQRCTALGQKMQKVITNADDSTLQSVFEVTLLPSLDTLLTDANYHLKLKNYAKYAAGGKKQVSRHGSAPKTLEPPGVPFYLPNPKPELNKDTHDKVEDMLKLLRTYLDKQLHG